jgi:hypothetical protein
MSASDLSDFFTDSNIRSLRFPNMRIAATTIKAAAMLCGFKIASARCLSIPYGHLFCSKGGKIKNPRNTTKCGCSFFIKFTTASISDSDSEVIPESFCLIHSGHQLKPDAFIPFTIHQDIASVVRSLRESGADYNIIKKFCETQDWPHLTTDMINKIVNRGSITKFSTQTNELIEQMQQRGDHAEVYEQVLEGDKRERLAVFTCTQMEYRDLIEFCDVIFLDSTILPLSLEWQVIPVTLIGNDKKLRCGGIFFTSVVTTDTIAWLLDYILTVDEVNRKLKVLITDDDNAFQLASESAFRKLNRDPGQVPFHVLCALHKKKNIIDRCNQLKLDKDSIKRAKLLVDEICFSSNRKNADKALGLLCDMHTGLREYLRKNIIPDIPRFSRSYLVDYTCIGYNTTSPAESLNYVFKRQKFCELSTLWQIRAHCSFALAQMRDANREVERTLRRNPTDYERELKFRLAPKILAEIAQEMQRASLIEITESNGTMFSLIEHLDGDRVAIYKATKEACECASPIFAGLPCRHIIKICNEVYNTNPVDCISPRWWFIPMNDDQLGQVSVNVTDNSNAEISSSEDDVPVVQENSIDEQSIISNMDPDNSENDETTSTERNRYLELFYKGKTIATLASRSKDAADVASFRLQKIINSLLQGQDESTNQTSGQSVVDVKDRFGRRPGRPKKTRLHGFPSSMSVAKTATKPETTPILSQATNPITKVQKRMCRICGEEGHDSRKCPVNHKKTSL